MVFDLHLYVFDVIDANHVLLFGFSNAHEIFLKFTQTLPFCFIAKHVPFNSFLGT